MPHCIVVSAIIFFKGILHALLILTKKVFGNVVEWPPMSRTVVFKN